MSGRLRISGGALSYFRVCAVAVAVLLGAAGASAAGQGGAAAAGKRPSSTAVRRVESFPRLKETRIKPQPLESLTPAQRELLGPGEGPIQVRLCVSNLDLCRRYWPLVQQNTIRNSTIPVRDHELLVLRTAWLLRSDTIWGNHVNCCAEKQAGLTREEIARIMEGPSAKGWSPNDAAILRAADELHTYRAIQAPTWNALARRFNDGQMFEILMTVGNYTNVIGYFNTFGVQPSNGTAGIPVNFNE